MTDLEHELARRLKELRDAGLYRRCRQVDSPTIPHIQVEGQTLLNFSSNNYLGLANHPAVKEASLKAISQFGAGAGASRLISGSQAPHHQLESDLALFKNTEAALSFSSGYTAALGTIGALVGKRDVIVLDKLVHACIVD